MTTPTSVAFYLPQFHPIPENDEWWGNGFTEWTNVRRARSMFRGHQQPKVPAELGYYDLRDPQIRIAQAELATRHGIGAFCYYHYWFNGKRLLEQPLDAVLSSGEPDMPFMLCWANENWTRVWDGGRSHLLLEQRYSEADDRDHIHHLVQYFEDPRYVRVGGRPVVLIYRPALLPEPRRTADTWRSEAQRLGVGVPYICHVEAFADEVRDPATIGFDAAVEFAPDFRLIPPLGRVGGALQKLSARGLAPRRRLHRVFDYDKLIEIMLAKPARSHSWFRAMTPGFDNTPRRKIDGLIVKGTSPALFQRWATELFVDAGHRNSPFVFINAWNEWAEGAYLEPDEYWGHGFLAAHQTAQQAARARLGE